MVYLSNLLFDTLLSGALDETAAAYGLLAQDVQVSADGMSATFVIREAARFHNGDPVLALDVKHSFDTLNSSFAAPGYRTALEDVAGAEVIGLQHSVSLQTPEPRVAVNGGWFACI